MNKRGITLEYRIVFLYNETKMAPNYFPAKKAGMKGRRNGKTDIAKYTIKNRPRGLSLRQNHNFVPCCEAQIIIAGIH